MEANHLARFWSKVTWTSGGCWNWTGAKFHYGHGVFRYRGKNLKAHRVSAELFLGSSDGRQVNHHCDNPSCVNPRHLYYGTQKQNCEDRERRGRGRGVPPTAVGESNGNSKLNAAEVLQIRQMCSEGHTNSHIGRMFNISNQLVSAIKLRQVWKHLSQEVMS